MFNSLLKFFKNFINEKIISIKKFIYDNNINELRIAEFIEDLFKLIPIRKGYTLHDFLYFSDFFDFLFYWDHYYRTILRDNVTYLILCSLNALQKSITDFFDDYIYPPIEEGFFFISDIVLFIDVFLKEYVEKPYIDNFFSNVIFYFNVFFEKIFEFLSIFESKIFFFLKKKNRIKNSINKRVKSFMKFFYNFYIRRIFINIFHKKKK